MLDSRISQIARRIESLDRARIFLRDTLGITELYAFPGLAFFDLSGTRLMLRETGRRDEADILYFSVPEIGAAHADLSQKGVTFSSPPYDPEAPRRGRGMDGLLQGR